MKAYFPMAIVAALMPFLLAPQACFSIPTGPTAVGPAVDYEVIPDPARGSMPEVKAVAHLSDGSACNTSLGLSFLGNDRETHSMKLFASADGTLQAQDLSRDGNVLYRVGTYERVGGTTKLTVRLSAGIEARSSLRSQGSFGTLGPNPALCDVTIAQLPVPSPSPSPAPSY